MLNFKELLSESFFGEEIEFFLGEDNESFLGEASLFTFVIWLLCTFIVVTFFNTKGSDFDASYLSILIFIKFCYCCLRTFDIRGDTGSIYSFYSKQNLTFLDSFLIYYGLCLDTEAWLGLIVITVKRFWCLFP